MFTNNLYKYCYIYFGLNNRYSGEKFTTKKTKNAALHNFNQNEFLISRIEFQLSKENSQWNALLDGWVAMRGWLLSPKAGVDTQL